MAVLVLHQQQQMYPIGSPCSTEYSEDLFFHTGFSDDLVFFPVTLMYIPGPLRGEIGRTGYRGRRSECEAGRSRFVERGVQIC